MIIAKNCFVTVCLKDNPIFHTFSENKVKKFFTYKKTRFSFQILYLMATSYLKYLKQISKKTDAIEKELHQSMKNKELFSLLNFEKSLVYFTTSLKSNNIVMQKMLKSNYLKMYEDDQELLEDVIIENQQAIEMAETHTSILSGMMDAFASVISNNVNIVIKFLTSIYDYYVFTNNGCKFLWYECSNSFSRLPIFIFYCNYDFLHFINYYSRYFLEKEILLSDNRVGGTLPCRPLTPPTYNSRIRYSIDIPQLRFVIFFIFSLNLCLDFAGTYILIFFCLRRKGNPCSFSNRNGSTSE